MHSIISGPDMRVLGWPRYAQECVLDERNDVKVSSHPTEDYGALGGES